MRRNSHLLISFSTILFMYALYLSWHESESERVYFEFWGVISIIFAGLVGGLLPDILEPPVHWTHRGFFHSLELLGFLVFFLLIGWASSISRIHDPIALFIFLTMISYCSHLLADSTTRMGLPSIFSFSSNRRVIR